MNTKNLARSYGSLTPEERFRLILIAGARGDEAEAGRLGHAAQRIDLSMSDHAPYGHAFDELAVLVFVELLDEAVNYRESLERADEYRDLFSDDAEEDEPTDQDKASPKRPAWQRTLDIALAAGFKFKTKVDGWKRFCERLNIPPFSEWERLPGFDRLKGALALAEGDDDAPGAAFTAEGMLHWLNRIRPLGEPALTEVPLTVERVADSTEDVFRQSVASWGGESK